jgi:hypothetical protein
VIDIEQRRCGHEGCIMWRLSRPGSAGQEWRPCSTCGTTEPPTGETYQDHLTRSGQHA